MVALALFLVSSSARAAAPVAAAYADPPLPDGSLAVWGSVGFPGIDIGYRQGFSTFELGAEAGFDYTLTDLHADIPLMWSAYSAARWKIGVGGSIGGFADLGATYYDGENQLSAGLRLAFDSVATYSLSENLFLVGEIQIPGEFALTNQGSIRAGPLFGGGLEVGLGDGYTVAGRVLLGPQIEHPISGTDSDQLRFNADVQVAVGKRFF
jgi:hypothetical protein